MAAKTINEKAVEAVKEFKVMVDVCAKRKAEILDNKEFKANKEYKALLDAKQAANDAVAAYEMEAVKASEPYNKAVLLTVAKGVRAFGYRYGVATMKNEQYLDSVAFADKVAKHGQYIDTVARLASLVASIYEDVNEKKVVVTKKTPLSISDIRLLLQMVSQGLMTREEARERVAKGR